MQQTNRQWILKSRPKGALSSDNFEPRNLGGSCTTAFWGLMDIGQPQKGETVVVSGSAGATGSVAAQIAKLKRLPPTFLRQR